MCNFIYVVSGSLISFFFLWIEIRVSQIFCRKLQVFVDPLLSNLFSCIYGFYADLLLLHKRNVNSLFIISEKISTTFLKLPLLHKIFPTKIPKLQFKSCTEYCQIGFKEKTWQCVDTQLIEVNKSAGKFKQKFQIFSRNKWENGVQYEEGKCIVLFTKPTKIGGKIQSFYSFFSCGPSSSGEMVSRRKILSRSRDDLHMEAPVPEDEEDIWYHKEKLYKVRQKS